MSDAERIRELERMLEATRADLLGLSLELLKLDESYELLTRSYSPWGGFSSVLVQLAEEARERSGIVCAHPSAIRVSFAEIRGNFGPSAYQCRECRFIHYDDRDLDRGLAPGTTEAMNENDDNRP